MGCFNVLLILLLALMLLLRSCGLLFAPEPVRVESASASVGKWEMICHEGVYEPDYHRGKALVLHADGRAECRGLMLCDLGGLSKTPAPATGTWKLYGEQTEDAQTLELSLPGKRSPLYLHAQFYREGGYGDGPYELWFRTASDPDVLEWVRYGRAVGGESP